MSEGEEMKSGDQVWYGISRTLNMGNYESVRFEIGESKSIEPGVDSEEIYRELRKICNGRMAAIVNKMKEKDTEE